MKLETLNFIIPQDVSVAKSENQKKENERSLKMFKDLQTRIPNLPVLSWLARKSVKGSKKFGCSTYPSILDIEYSNKYWQLFRYQDSTFYLYGAYLDNRTLVINGPMIRISLVLHHNSREQLKSMPFCHIWYKDSKAPIVSRVTKFEKAGAGYGWPRNKERREGLLNPFLMGCRPPATHRHLVPESVSLVDRRCHRDKVPSNNLRVNFDKPEARGGIAVCSKSLSHLGDVSTRFIEWIELLRSLQAEKIILSILSVHPNVMKVIYIHLCK